MNRKGQVTIFIIVAVVLISLVAGYFLLKDKLFVPEVPSNIEPVYIDFLTCLENEVLVGVDVLETQAGYIYLPDFEAGSEYMPFGSQLNFLGNPVPYWYYISGNNIQKEQVPSKNDMENDLEKFIEEKIRRCKFDSYYDEGFEISQGITKGEETSLIKTHNLVVDSKLGALYNSAKKIYSKEQEELFLEEYAVDILRLYAPVDGVELTCSPMVWSAEKIFDNLKEAIEENTLTLKSRNGDFKLKQEDEYFVLDLGVNENVRFINSRNWSNGFEVAPSEGSILISKPVGNQAGLGILGFCYVPYHFVYNVRYPVLVQISDEEEIFQFPMAVVLQGNNPREALDATASELSAPELCEYKNNFVKVSVYDSNLNPVEAEISYECFGSSCNIGKTSEGKLIEEFPQCVNGYIQTRAEGYEDFKYLFSTTEEGSVDIILNKIYSINLNLKLDGVNYNNDAIISFISDKSSRTIVYPQQKEIELSEGQYEVQVAIYKNSSLKLESTSSRQCIEIPQSGVGGLVGVTEEKCFEIEIPSQIISNVLIGGGKQNYYLLESELKNSNLVEIDADSLSTPTSIEELQNNYIIFENKNLDITFK